METRKPISALFEQIDSEVGEGEHLLGSAHMRTQVEMALEDGDITLSKNTLRPRQLMVELTVLVLFHCRDSLAFNRYSNCLRLLPPLKRIKDVGCSKEFANVVKVGSDCRLQDTRMSLSKFVKGLSDYLNRGKS